MTLCTITDDTLYSTLFPTRLAREMMGADHKGYALHLMQLGPNVNVIRGHIAPVLIRALMSGALIS